MLIKWLMRPSIASQSVSVFPIRAKACHIRHLKKLSVFQIGGLIEHEEERDAWAGLVGISIFVS